MSNMLAYRMMLQSATDCGHLTPLAGETLDRLARDLDDLHRDEYDEDTYVGEVFQTWFQRIGGWQNVPHYALCLR